MKIAVVRNRKKEGIIYRYGKSSPETYGRKSVQRVMDALRAYEHEVNVMEGDISMFHALKKFIPPDENNRPAGLVFNMSYGIQGQARYTHVPGMLEMIGLPYTGATPLGHAIALDKVVTKRILAAAGIATPKMAVVSKPDARAIRHLHFPLVVKPRQESTSCGLHLVENHDDFISAVLTVTAQFQQDVLVEEFIEGREFCVGVIGNDDLEILPFVELDFGGRKHAMLTREDKFHRTRDEPQKVCPVKLDANLEKTIREMVAETFRLCHCRDYARVDLRLDEAGNPFILEINSMASLGQGGTFVTAAKEAGYSFESLINRIVTSAAERSGLNAMNIVHAKATHCPAEENKAVFPTAA